MLAVPPEKPPPWIHTITGSGRRGSVFGVYTLTTRQSSAVRADAAGLGAHLAEGRRVPDAGPRCGRLRRPPAQRADRRRGVRDAKELTGVGGEKALHRPLAGPHDQGGSTRLGMPRRHGIARGHAGEPEGQAGRGCQPAHASSGCHGVPHLPSSGIRARRRMLASRTGLRKLVAWADRGRLLTGSLLHARGAVKTRGAVPADYLMAVGNDLLAATRAAGARVRHTDPAGNQRTITSLPGGPVRQLRVTPGLIIGIWKARVPTVPCRPARRSGASENPTGIPQVRDTVADPHRNPTDETARSRYTCDARFKGTQTATNQC